jgi:hypothetical protein
MNPKLQESKAMQKRKKRIEREESRYRECDVYHERRTCIGIVYYIILALAWGTYIHKRQDHNLLPMVQVNITGMKRGGNVRVLNYCTVVPLYPPMQWGGGGSYW